MSDPMNGYKLDERYTLLEKVGSGSMGSVYRARQHTTARDVAVKILRGDKAVDANSKARFMREARANSLLTSPNTVTVFDFGQAKTGELFLAMELLSGESLGERLKDRGKLTPEEAVDVGIQVLASLAEAHALGLVHRDLKPDNVFFARVHGASKEIVKVLDFGIAKFITGDSPINAIETQAGTVFGTPRYMSPEQAQGKPLDGRSDLYSLGVILYHVLTGRAPFTDDDAVIVMARHIKGAPKPPREIDPTIHPKLEALVLRALAKLPEERFASAEELTEALEAVRFEGAFRVAATGPVPAAVPSEIDLATTSAGRSMETVAQSVLPPEKSSPTWLYALLSGLVVAIGFFVVARSLAASATAPRVLKGHPPIAAATPPPPPADSTLPFATSSVDAKALPPAVAIDKRHRTRPRTAPSSTGSSGYGIFE